MNYRNIFKNKSNRVNYHLDVILMKYRKKINKHRQNKRRENIRINRYKLIQ
jgi:hypothetical protein